MRNVVYRSLAVAALILFPCLSLRSQMNVGGIVGTVTDTSGAVVPAAKVSAVNEGTTLAQTTVTNSTGSYVFNALPIGHYTVTVTASGFQTVKRISIQVVSGETTTVNVVLRVGRTTQTVTVTAALPGLDTTTSNEGTSRTNQEIQALPITLYGDSARSAAGLAKTLPGVSYDAAESGGQEFMEMSRAQINGIDAGSWTYDIDGVDAGAGNAERGHDMAPPTPEVVQEVRLTANNDASHPFSPGVSLELSEKSGTNQLHGSAYWYVRNDAFEARNIFLSQVPEDKQNDGGITLGGPVIIPKIYNGKDKTFFFTNLDTYRFRTTLQGDQEQVTGSVATQAMRNGDFSQLLGPQIGTDALGRPIYQGEIYNPATTQPLPGGGFIRSPFPNNVIPSSMLSPISQAILTQEALPNRPGTADNWVGPNEQTLVDKDQWFLKFDHIINSNNRFTFAYERVIPWLLGAYGETKGVNTGDSGHSYIAGGPGYLGPAETGSFIDDRNEYRYRFNYVWTARPNLLVSFRAGITRTPGRLISWFPYTGPQVDFGRQVGLKGTLDPHDPTVNIQGYSSLGDTFTHYTTPNQEVPVDLDVSWVKGSHNFKFGAHWISERNDIISEGEGFGTWNFNDTESGLPGFGQTGSGMASFMLGELDNASISTPYTQDLMTGAWGFYGQDSWRLTRKLTVHYGLGWNLYIPAREHNNEIGTFDPTISNPGAGGIPGALALYGSGPDRNGDVYVSNYYLKAFAPHIGIAYALTPKTVLRANFGISYGAGTMTTWEGGGLGPALPNPGFAATLTPASVNNGVTPAFNWDNGFPLAFPTHFPSTNPALENGTSLGYIDRNFDQPPMVESVGFEIGRELPGDMTLRVAYVGTFAHYLPTSNADSLDFLPLADYQKYGSLLTASADSSQAQAAGIALPYAGFVGSVAQALLPYPQYLGVPVLNDPEGNSSYNGVQINLQKRFGHGLSVLVDYTASKLLATSAGFATAATVGGGIGGTYDTDIQNPQMKNTAELIDPSDRPQVLNLSWTYDLPFGAGRRFMGHASPAVDRVIGGWRFSAIQNYFAGRPIFVTTEETIPFSSLEPVRVPGVPFGVTGCSAYDPNNPAKNRYLNVNAFATPAPFTFGNISELPDLRSCGFDEEDLGLDKAIAVTERTGFHIGTLWQNAFNRHTWETLNTDINSPAFGEYEAAYPARNIQFYVRYDF
jgi:Carboxypeptidase regulatory-like domain